MINPHGFSYTQNGLSLWRQEEDIKIAGAGWCAIMLLLCTRAHPEWSPQGLYYPLKYKNGTESRNIMVLAVKKRVKCDINVSTLLSGMNALHIQPHTQERWLFLELLLKNQFISKGKNHLCRMMHLPSSLF